jgi:protein-tyrosine-phosphatase
MAEGFARAYGSDVMDVWSAGLSPAMVIAPLTKKVLAERNISLEEHFPKGLNYVPREPFDIVVNMSGSTLDWGGARVLEWLVRDPIGQKEEVYRSVASEIERLVMRLILELRSAPR